ncbi:calcium-binding protein, putative [Bodo saltans]|uniref:Calcium-binding protein, putative n=1 Tax=Bodo saltans TaxID=75058 RepID=A0A0S4JUY4_BODSA|nr:calcium-binding protein, putative [Bodo saltans]|eukprot:CUG94042.1 calcium-binding protein, putative [Bodo saltans]
MGNEQSGAGGAGGQGGGPQVQNRTINKGNHPPPLPLLAEAEKAQMKRQFPHAKRLYLSALESIIHYTGEDSIETARCRVKVGEMCMQEKKFEEAIVYLRLALSSMETMRKDVNPKITPTQAEIKKLMGDIAFCEYNMAQRESRGSSNYNKLSIAALQKFQAISELSEQEAANPGQEVYVTELIGQDFTDFFPGGTYIPETGGQALESAMAGVNVHSDIGKAANGMQVARDAQECVNAVRDTAQQAEDDNEEQMKIRQANMATPEVRAVAKRSGGNRADCNLIVASLHANTNNPVEARKVLQSTATMQRKRKVPVNATQRLAVGLDEQMRQLNALRLIQRGLMRIIRRIRIRKIFLLQRELIEEWETEMRGAIYEFEDDICYNWTGLEGDSRDAKLEEEALRYEMIRDEVDDLMIAEQMDHEDLEQDEQIEFDLLMSEYQEFLADLEFAQRYNPEHWQLCINQLQDDEPNDRAKIRKREQEEWDALMQMMRISAMGAKRKEDERHAAYARIKRDINEGLDAGADHIRKEEDEEWQRILKLHYEGLINNLIEEERRARPKAVDLAYQREFWRNLADEEEDERVAAKVREEKRMRALRLASEDLERQMMAAYAKLVAEEQEAWNKMLRLQKKELPLALKREAEGRKREEVQQRRGSKVLPKRRSSMSGTLTAMSELPDMTIPEVVEVVEVVPEAPLTPTEPPPMKARRRSVRAPTGGTTEETSHFLLEEDEQQQREVVDEIDATPSVAPVSPPVEVTPQETPVSLGGRRRTMVKRSGATTTAAIDIGMTEEPEVTPINEDINTELTNIQTRRRSAASVSPAMPTPEVTPVPAPPPRRRSNPQLQKRGANRVEEATAQMIDDDNAALQDIVEEETDGEITGIKRRSSRSSVSPQQSQLSPLPMDTPPPASKQTDMRKRSSKNIRQRAGGAGAQAEPEVFLPEDEGQAIADSEDEGRGLAMVSARRRASSVSPRDLTLAVGAGATAVAVAKRTASTRRQTKRVVSGTTVMNEATLPDEEVSVAIDESDGNDLPQTALRRRQSSVSPATEVLSPPPPPPPKPKRAASARRQVKRVGSGATLSNEAVLPEEEASEAIDESDSNDLPQTALRRRASSVSPGSMALAQPEAAAAPAAVKRSTSTARRQSKRVVSGTTVMNEATLPDEEVSEAIDESETTELSQAPVTRRRSFSVSPPVEPLSPPPEVAAPATKRTASNRRTVKRAGSGSTLANEAALPEEEAPQAIEENDSNDLPMTTATRRRSFSVSPPTETVAPPEAAVAPVAATKRTSSNRRTVKRTGSGTTQANEAALPDEEVSEAIDETNSHDLQTTGLRRRASSISPVSRGISPHEVTSADESSQSGAASRSKVSSRRQISSRTHNSGQQSSSNAVMIEEQQSTQVEDDESNAGIGRRQRSGVGSQRRINTTAVSSESNGIQDDEEKLVSMPKRTRNRRTSGTGSQNDVAATTVDEEEHNVVDDMEASKLVPAARRRSSLGTDLADAVQRTTFGDEVHSSEFGRGSITTDGSQSRLRSSRHRSSKNSTTSSVNADAFDEVNSAGIVEEGSDTLMVASPPRAITPQEASNPRRISAVVDGSPPQNALRRKESDAADQRDARHRMLSEAQLKEEGAALIKRLMVRVQRTKMFMMTADDVETIRTLFTNCDKDSNGVVSREEFSSYAGRVLELPNLTHREVEGMFDKMDVDHSGNLSFAEFAELYKHLAMEEVSRRDPALADAVKRGIPMKRRKSVNRASQQIFATQASKAIGEEIDDDLAASLCVDQELMRTAADWNNISSYVENRPSQIGNKRLEELKTAIQGKVTTTRRAVNRGRGHAASPFASAIGNDEAGAVVEGEEGAMVSKRRSSRRQDSHSPATSPLSPNIRHRGSTQSTAATMLEEEEATAIEEEFEGLRQQRQSNRNHRVLWDRDDRPPWSLPALDELEHNQSVRDALSNSSRDDAMKYLRELSNAKEQQNEDLFKKFPFLEALPKGVPLSELGLESNAAIAALMARRKSRNAASNAEVEKKIVVEVNSLATARNATLDSYVEKQGDFAVQLRELVASEKTQRRMSRRRSSLGKEVQSDSSSDSDTDAIMQRLHDEREADINRRRHEIMQGKEDEARRKADQEEALRRQRENDAHSLKAKNQRLRQAANNKAEAEGMIKRCIIRAGKAGASGEAELDVNDLTTIKSHFDNYDNDDAGAINRNQFLEFYMATFDGISSIAKKDIDEIFKTFASDGSELNFMEFVEVYKHVANTEIQKKEEKLGRKKSNVAGPSRVQSMAPKKPTAQRTQSNVRPRN